MISPMKMKETTTITIHSFLTVAEVAEKTDVTRDTVRLWIRRGKLVARKMGRDYIIDALDVASFQIPRGRYNRRATVTTSDVSDGGI